jgi:hypothetical protein
VHYKELTKFVMIDVTSLLNLLGPCKIDFIRGRIEEGTQIFSVPESTSVSESSFDEGKSLMKEIK